MTPVEREVALALGQCSFLPASWDKRFCRDMAREAEYRPEAPLTAPQAAHLLRLTHKYRRQLPTRILIAAHEEMERHAARRVDAGKSALPDFTPARVIKHQGREAARNIVAEPAPIQLSLLAFDSRSGSWRA